MKFNFRELIVEKVGELIEFYDFENFFVRIK
jgi:hypothetical protein